MKRIEIKVYDKSWVFKKNINENQNWQKLLMSDISFDYQKDWWQWQINLKLNKAFNSTDIIRSDFIKIYLYDENFPTWKLIYTWVIEEINRNYNVNDNSIEYVCRWLSSILTRFFYYDSWYTFSKTDTASNIIKSIINYANTKYNWFNTSWIVDTVWNITVEFDYTSCFDALEKVLEQTELFLFIWEDGTVYFNNTPSQNYVTAKEDLQELSIVEDGSEIINKVIVVYTARPNKDRELYIREKIPNGIFVTTKFSEAEGYALEFGNRDIFKIWIKKKYLVTTLDAGYKNYFLMSNEKFIPIEKIELLNN